MFLKCKASKPRSLIYKNQLHLLVGDLQELQHHTVSSHVPQQPLLLLLTLLPRTSLLDAQLTETQQDLTTHSTLFLFQATIKENPQKYRFQE